MFCSQCGKRVIENMLFCPFCGSPIVIPEQDEAPAQRASSERQDVHESESAAEPKEKFVPLNLQMDWPEEPESEEAEEEAEEFVPLNMETDEAEEPATPEPQAAEKKDAAGDMSGEISELLSRQLREEPVKLGGHVPDLTHVRAPKPEHRGERRPANTFAPQKAFNSADIFLDGGYEDEEEDDEEDYTYEEPEHGGFWIRHIRGVVALSLLLIVLAIVFGWAMSGTGQQALARANLAWNPSVYEKMGFDAYEAGNYSLSAEYYARALARDDDNYSYAKSAAIAYYLAQDTQNAVEMAKKAISIRPEEAETYQLLLRIYPDAQSRPWEITSLLQQGYRLTGDASLKTE